MTCPKLSGTCISGDRAGNGSPEGKSSTKEVAGGMSSGLLCM